MNNRQKHSKDRRAYEKANPLCEICKCRKTVTTHHIVQGSRSYEDPRVYMAICFKCHDDNRHTNMGKYECIAIKIRKGTWFATEQEERDFFGGRLHWKEW